MEQELGPTDAGISLPGAIAPIPASTALLARRNRQVGQLLLAERAGAYVTVLHRLLLFRRAHELEPLYDDIYAAVANDPTQRAEVAVYSPDQFRQDLQQLEDWQLVGCRIEKERLRGYKDTRKRKFRYRLADETVAFLEWLEQRCQEDARPHGPDTRDLLEEVRGSLRELLRLLQNHGSTRAREDDPRRALYQLHKLDELTMDVAKALGELNARLWGFVLASYDLAQACRLVQELERYVAHFLRQVMRLGQDLAPEWERLQSEVLQRRLAACAAGLAAEVLPGRAGDAAVDDPTALARRCQQLQSFYRDDGKLAQLCQAVNTTCLHVQRKLHLHVRELERRSHRLEDLRARLAELATTPPGAVPHTWLWTLLQPARQRSDPHEWDEHTRANPDLPRHAAPTRVLPKHFLAAKRPAHAPPVRSLDEARLADLCTWFEARVTDHAAGPWAVSAGRFDEPADFVRVLELARAGLLSRGRRLQRLHYTLTPLSPAVAATITIGAQRLTFGELNLGREATP